VHLRDPGTARNLVLSKLEGEPQHQYLPVARPQSAKRTFEADRKLNPFVIRVVGADRLSTVNAVAV
jgi:hypothetical protein